MTSAAHLTGGTQAYLPNGLCMGIASEPAHGTMATTMATLTTAAHLTGYANQASQMASAWGLQQSLHTTLVGGRASLESLCRIAPGNKPECSIRNRPLRPCTLCDDRFGKANSNIGSMVQMAPAGLQTDESMACTRRRSGFSRLNRDQTT